MLIFATHNAFAEEIHTKLKSLFGNKSFVINDYDDQLKEVVVDSTKVYFATHDGQYLFAGPIIDIEKRTNIVDSRENKVRRSYINSLPENITVTYPSSGAKKYEITVFTDIDCPYCRRFHNDMNNYNELGVTVNYLMLPRSGVGSSSYKKTVAALCAENPSESITLAMQNIAIAAKTCENNMINQHIKIARDLNISNTPTIILPNGQLKLGQVKPKQLLILLNGL